MTITMRMPALAGALSAVTTGQAAELKVVSGNGARAAMRELCTQFERTTDRRIALHFEVNAALQRKTRQTRHSTWRSSIRRCSRRKASSR